MSLIEKIDGSRTLAFRFLALVLFLSLASRMLQISAPIEDDHSWNQCSAATVIRNFYNNGIDFLHPEWNHLDKNTNARKIGAEEFPIYHAVTALLYHVSGEKEAVPRLISIFFSLIGAFYLFLLMSRRFGNASGVLTAFFYCFAPLNWFFGRAVMSDAAMLTAIIAALHHFSLWVEEGRNNDFLYSLLWTMAAGLLKPYALVIAIPLSYLAYSRFSLRLLLRPRLYIFAVLVAGPTLLWLSHALSVGDLGGVTDTANIGSTTKIWGPLSMLWDPQFYYRLQWRLFDRAITPVASILVAIGLIFYRGKQTRLIHFWLLGVLAYLLIIRGGNYIHNYYQLLFVAPASALAALGLLKVHHVVEKRQWAPWIPGFLLLSFFFVANIYVQNHFRSDQSSTIAGKLAEKHTSQGDLIYVIDPGSTRKNQVIYYSQRRGWHANHCKPERIAQYRELGASMLVTVLDLKQDKKFNACMEEIRKTYPVAAKKFLAPEVDPKEHSIELFHLTD